MAEVTYNQAQTQTRNHARLLEVSVQRELDASGAFSGFIIVSGLVLVGNFNAGTFTEHARIPFRERRAAATVAAHYTGSVLQTLEQKTLERLQTTGELPAGNIS